MAVGSSYSVMKTAIVTRLSARAGLANVNVLARTPVGRDDIRTPVGTYEAIYTAGARGNLDDVVFCGPNDLRFDEDYTLDVTVEVLGDDTSDTQEIVDARANTLLYEVLADVSDQASWDFAALGLDVFDYLYFTPATIEWSPGRIEGPAGAYGTACTLGIGVRARRSF